MDNVPPPSQLHHVHCEGAVTIINSEFIVPQLCTRHAEVVTGEAVVKIINFRDSFLEWCIKQINIVIIIYYCTIRSNPSSPPEKHFLELFRYVPPPDIEAPSFMRGQSIPTIILISKIRIHIGVAKAEAKQLRGLGPNSLTRVARTYVRTYGAEPLWLIAQPLCTYVS